MNHLLRVLALGALLHDLGKVVRRAGGGRETHSAQGAAFLSPFCHASEDGRQILQCIKYHHGKELSGANLPTDALAYVVYEADNIAAGLDRRDKEEKENWGFESTSSLENVCNRLEKPREDSLFPDSYFSLKKLDAKEAPNYPVENGESLGTKGAYGAIVDSLKANFQRKAPQDMEPNELLRILEDTMVYVPSSTAMQEVCDISLYDHVKMTAAIAGAMMRYMRSHGIADYKTFCFTEGKAHRQDETMLFVSGDFSGIQKFIYRVPTKGAMRMLRGRSFYLQMVLENAIDDLLDQLGLSRANLIYSGGGHFYMLVDHSEETKEILRKGFEEINRKLLSLYGTALYLAAGWVPVCAAELMDEMAVKENMFRRVNGVVAKKKQNRYSVDMIRAMTDPTSALNHMENGMRECGICHRSVKESELRAYEAQKEDDAVDIENMQVCPQCNGMYLLGKSIIDDHPILAVLNQRVEDSLDLAALGEGRWLKAIDSKAGQDYQKKGCLVRIYSKNDSSTSELISSRLWVGDYACEKDGKALDFGEMALWAGGEKEEKGIKRLGVLRADVDWLGATFMAGIPKTYRTLSRLAALSRSLSMFFAKIITDVCQKRLPKGQKPFYLFQKKPGDHMVHIVYSGGDDLFLVGAWDDLLEMAVDLREAFRRYTNGKLSFSAGWGIFSPSYPVIRMAKDTGDLEDLAKKTKKTKDSLALFGTAAEEGQVTPVFSWQDFQKNVCHEKLDFLLSHFYLEGIDKGEDSREKIPAGKSLLYRILELLQAKPFNLARFAYTLARLEPTRKGTTEAEKACYREIREKLYQWGRGSEEEQLALETALRLVIYRMRDKED